MVLVASWSGNPAVGRGNHCWLQKNGPREPHPVCAFKTLKPNGVGRGETVNVVLSLCVQMGLLAPRALCLLAPPSSSSSSWGPCPFVLGRRGPKIITKLGNWLARRFPILVIIFRWAPAEANAYMDEYWGREVPQLHLPLISGRGNY